jgi:hypothetical protein
MRTKALRLKRPTDACTECGNTDGAMRASLDAGNQQHWFHPLCWKRFVKAMTVSFK